MPRKAGMERKDLLAANVKIFKVQGAALDKCAKKDVKVCGKFFYTPNFKEVEGAYWFGPVRPSVRLSVRNTWQLKNLRTAYARILKFYMWHVHEK